MGRLFWKFFLSILLAQLAATVGIGGAIWLKHRNPERSPTADIDTSPPAEMAINAAAATLEFGGSKALRGLLDSMERHRVYAVDDKGHELLDRVVTPAMQLEAYYLLQHEQRHRVVRQVRAKDGRRYLLFLPSAEHQQGLDSMAPPLLARLAESGLGRGPGGPAAGGPGVADNAGEPARPPADGQAGDAPRWRPVGTGPDMRGPGGPRGPRFEPLAPWVPIIAAVLASTLMAVLLAWYFSRPIRALRQAFEAAAGGDLAPRFADAGGKRRNELNDLGRDFDRMTARLRKLIDGQTRLLHDVSHELRSPLARLQAAIGLAHQQPDKTAASMERIERESVRMDKLVGELLTLARLEAGALGAPQEEIDMAELLDQIGGDARFEAASQQRSVVQEGEADVLVLGQAELLGRAIENVVRNAIKHSPEGGVVQLQLRSLPDARHLHIRVLDRGPGVAPTDLEAIFRPFFRANDTHKSTDGHGLGLAIAQHVVQAHGGSIVASNRPDGGLCVEIVLPVLLRHAAP
ncbi:cell wall metabolism sensor histidine kinase WalK [Rugamonas sp. DEMB1]|uniref:sensor histidine kinase n=1 Tax=Rugamonas sp. DEMB1 TaxID=3039386 RepID=UPI00244BC642|nr:ATP-binding protein [Rugamonas sp. DEMB1]WGG53306.1 ATP-binding protein [Rugamonas sp. DEMB1]